MKKISRKSAGPENCLPKWAMKWRRLFRISHLPKAAFPRLLILCFLSVNSIVIVLAPYVGDEKFRVDINGMWCSFTITSQPPYWILDIGWMRYMFILSSWSFEHCSRLNVSDFSTFQIHILLPEVSYNYSPSASVSACMHTHARSPSLPFADKTAWLTLFAKNWNSIKTELLFLLLNRKIIWLFSVGYFLLSTLKQRYQCDDVLLGGEIVYS